MTDYDEPESFVLFDYPVRCTREEFAKLVVKAMTCTEYVTWAALVHIVDSIYLNDQSDLNHRLYLERKCYERADAHTKLTKAVYKILFP